MKVKYSLYRNNMDATKEKAPYLGRVEPVAELAYDDVVAALVADSADAQLIRFFFAALWEFILEDMPANLNRYNLGAFAIEAKISGSLPSEDAELDPEANEVIVGATLAQDVLDAVGAIVPARDTASVPTNVRLNTVMDIASQTYATVDGVKEFRLAGQRLYVSEADEYVRLRAADGTVSPCTVTKTDENGQRVYAKLGSALPSGTYTLEIASHGGDAEQPLALVTRKVKVLGPAAPKTVTLARVFSASHEAGGTNEVKSGEAIRIAGTNLNLLDGDTVTARCTSMGEPRDLPVTVTASSAEAIDLAWRMEYDSSDDGGIAFTVTSRGGVADGEVQVNTIHANVHG